MRWYASVIVLSLWGLAHPLGAADNDVATAFEKEVNDGSTVSMTTERVEAGSAVGGRSALNVPSARFRHCFYRRVPDKADATLLYELESVADPKLPETLKCPLHVLNADFQDDRLIVVYKYADLTRAALVDCSKEKKKIEMERAGIIGHDIVGVPLEVESVSIEGSCIRGTLTLVILEKFEGRTVPRRVRLLEMDGKYRWEKVPSPATRTTGKSR